MDEKFSSLEELYARLLPALRSKENELHQNHMIYITRKDIWQYFCSMKWNHSVNLTLYDMVDDILNTENYLIDDFVRMKKTKSQVMEE